jgi:hypothetical protein
LRWYYHHIKIKQSFETNSSFIPIIPFYAVSCKPTSTIITSKEEAQKRGIYKAPANIKIAAKNNAEPKSVAAKKSNLKKP